MGFLLRCRYWSVLVAIVACNQGKVSTAERVQGCVWSQLSLVCPEMKIIQITGVVLGDSSCLNSSCCIKDSDCTRDANANHRTEVNLRCNNKQSCTVGVLREKIPCGYWGVMGSNDFERITFKCINDHRNTCYGTEIALGCVGSQLNLRCEEMKVIEVMHVVIGDSNGAGTICNISDSNCTQIANANYTMDVHHRCDGQRNCTICDISDSNCTKVANSNHRLDVHHRCDSQRYCTVHVIQENISCGWLVSWSKNDFEFITYNCLNDSRNDTAHSTDEHTTETDEIFGNSSIPYTSGFYWSSLKPALGFGGKISKTSTKTTTSVVTAQHISSWKLGKFSAIGEIERQTEATTNAPVCFSSSILGIGIVGIVCLIITIGIIASVFVFVMVRRKKRKQVKSTEAAETVDGKTDRNEVIDINGDKRTVTSLETSANVYCELDGAPTEGVYTRTAPCDSEYMQLYEPLAVHNEEP